MPSLLWCFCWCSLHVVYQELQPTNEAEHVDFWFTIVFGEEGRAASAHYHVVDLCGPMAATTYTSIIISQIRRKCTHQTIRKGLTRTTRKLGIKCCDEDCLARAIPLYPRLSYTHTRKHKAAMTYRQHRNCGRVPMYATPWYGYSRSSGCR